MPQTKDKQGLPKLDEWKAPWEVDGDGKDIPEDEQEIDKPRLKKYLHGLLSDKINIRKSLDDQTQRVQELEAEIEKATDPKQLEKLQEQVATLRKERDDAAAKAKGSADALKWEIALDKGLTKTQAKRLVGTTREELEADADELLASWGHQGKGGNEEEGGEGETIRRAPRRNLTNSGDPDPGAGKGEKEPNPDDVVKAYFATRG